ncbi:MAG: hypothetical protein H6559_29130 [Lewinellaceae bacterium]|nr:hypothetical protein [Lewinellaceae bacterium]
MLESFYESVFCYELTKAGIAHQRQVGIRVKHDGRKWAYRLPHRRTRGRRNHCGNKIHPHFDGG